MKEMTVGWFDIDDGIRPFPFLLQTELTQTHVVMCNLLARRVWNNAPV